MVEGQSGQLSIQWGACMPSAGTGAGLGKLWGPHLHAFAVVPGVAEIARNPEVARPKAHQGLSKPSELSACALHWKSTAGTLVGAAGSIACRAFCSMSVGLPVEAAAVGAGLALAVGVLLIVARRLVSLVLVVQVVVAVLLGHAHRLQQHSRCVTSHPFKMLSGAPHGAA